MTLTKRQVQIECLDAIKEWLKRAKIEHTFVYCEWLDKPNGSIVYDNQPYKVKCELCFFLKIEEKIYHFFINFKINPFKYELNAYKKALLAERKNGLVNYDHDSKQAFRVTRKDKQAVFIFVANEISNEQINSWKSRVLCCFQDNLIPTIKHVISDMKAIKK